MTPVGFEPTPFRTGALSQRLRPLGQTVLVQRWGNCLRRLVVGAASKGLLRELNPGPLAPEARIMPLDQAANECMVAMAARIKKIAHIRACWADRCVLADNLARVCMVDFMVASL